MSSSVSGHLSQVASDSDGSDVFLDVAQSQDEHVVEGPAIRQAQLDGAADDAPNIAAEVHPSLEPLMTGHHADGRGSPPLRSHVQPRHSSRYSQNLAALRGQVQSSPVTSLDCQERLPHLGHRHSESIPGIPTAGRLSRSFHRPSSRGTSLHINSSPPESYSQHDTQGSDSGRSQTAPSTVWDELDDLKHRILSLESGGHSVKHSDAPSTTYVSARSPTATTNPTTISNTHEQGRKLPKTSPRPSINEPMPELHPTLQTALVKVRPTLRPHLFRPLEACVSDSLTLASMTAKAASLTYEDSNDGVADRRLRRKIDSLCRNLADLCVAMGDLRSEEMQSARSPVMLRDSSAEESANMPRGYDEPPHDAPSRLAGHVRHQSRMSISRLDDYRNARGIDVTETQSSPITRDFPRRSPSAVPKDYTKRYSMNSMSSPLGPASRAQTTNAGEPYARAPSRAMTEAGVGSLRGQIAKVSEMRTGSHRSPSLRETLEHRRRSAHYSSGTTVDRGGEVDDSDVRSQAGTDAPQHRTSHGVTSGADKRLSSHEMYGNSSRLGRVSSLSRRIFSG